VTTSDPAKKLSVPPFPEGEILVVDDDGPTRALIARWLKSAGFVCAEAASGEEALELVTGDPGKYEAMVLDVMMPGMDGFDVLKQLKTRPQTNGIPVLFLTASATEGDIVRGVEEGAADYLLKPFSGPVLVAKLRAIRQRSRAEWMLRRKLQSAEQNATTDGLTGLLNRRSFDDRLVELSAYSVRHREPLSLLMLDIDRFKSVNDEFGHPAGDVALRFVADRVRRVLRLGDLAFRYGGEEFAVLLRKCDAIGGLGVYDRLRDELKRAPVELGRGASRSLSVSAGLATMEVGNNFREGDLVSRADEALYRAKHGGRDKVEMETPAPAY
jgi:diguanylate cyclase (GGDEF)-like protein